MTREDVIQFFDRLAPTWDAEMMSQWFQVVVKISDAEKYIVSAFI